MNRTNVGWEAAAFCGAALGGLILFANVLWAVVGGGASASTSAWIVVGTALLIIGAAVYRPLAIRTARIAADRESAIVASYAADPRFSLPLGPGIPVMQGSLRDTRMVRVGGSLGLVFWMVVLTTGVVAKYLDGHGLGWPLLAAAFVFVAIAVAFPLVMVRFRPALLAAAAPEGLNLSSGRRSWLLRYDDIVWWRVDGGPDGLLITASTGAGVFGPAAQILLSDERILDLFVAKVGPDRLRGSHLTIASSSRADGCRNL